MTDPKSAPLDSALADRLLDLLSTDDVFRKRFAQDPRSALDSLGFNQDHTTMPSATERLPAPFSTCRVVQLASKKDIAAARAELRLALTQGLAYISPNFEASTLENRNKRS